LISHSIILEGGFKTIPLIFKANFITTGMNW